MYNLCTDNHQAQGLNCFNKVLQYCSWKPDPSVIAVDVITDDWHFYAFRPFNMIDCILQNVENEQAKGILVVPYWPTQPWFSKFTSLCTENPILFSTEAILILAHPWREEHQLTKVRILATPISGCNLRHHKSVKLP